MIRRFLVPAERNTLRLAGSLVFLFSSTASAAIHQNLHADMPNTLATVQAPSKSREAGAADVLSQYGIALGPEKSQMLAAWFDKVLQDPVIKQRFPGDAHALEQIFIDEGKREAVMSTGLARLPPAERLLYLQLFTRLLDELVPVNCFGLVDINAVINHITIAEMSNTDAELYLRLLFKVLLSSASDAAVRIPTAQQYSVAIEELSRAIVTELDADRVNLDRYYFYTVHRALATPADVCWMTRVTLHAIERMPETERDFVLVPAIIAPDAAPADGTIQRNPAQVPLPSRARRPGTTIP